MMLRNLILLSLFSIGVVHAEDMIDPSLISPIDCPKTVEIKIEPKVISKDIIGYERSGNIYTLDSVYVNTYVIQEVNGVLYKKHMVFVDGKWIDHFIQLKNY
jgi:hypothetical protein